VKDDRIPRPEDVERVKDNLQWFMADTRAATVADAQQELAAWGLAQMRRLDVW
jgi:hypothetical protein